MSAITVRQLPDGIKQRLRVQAAAHGRSMEAEARSILVSALSEGRQVDLGWVERLIAVGDDLGGVEVPMPPDTSAEAARFDP